LHERLFFKFIFILSSSKIINFYYYPLKLNFLQKYQNTIFLRPRHLNSLFLSKNLNPKILLTGLNSLKLIYLDLVIMKNNSFKISFKLCLLNDHLIYPVSINFIHSINKLYFPCLKLKPNKHLTEPYNVPTLLELSRNYLYPNFFVSLTIIILLFHRLLHLLNPFSNLLLNKIFPLGDRIIILILLKNLYSKHAHFHLYCKKPTNDYSLIIFLLN
jgi:hypothetical protein